MCTPQPPEPPLTSHGDGYRHSAASVFRRAQIIWGGEGKCSGGDIYAVSASPPSVGPQMAPRENPRWAAVGESSWRWERLYPSASAFAC